MADEGWSYPITHGASASCPTTAPVTDNTDAAKSATSEASTLFQQSSHYGVASSSSSSFLADPHMDWLPACMGGRAATASCNALVQVQLHGDAGSHFLLDQTPPHPHVQAQYDYDIDGTAPAAAAPRSATSLFAENKCSSVTRRSSVPGSPAAAKKPRIEMPSSLPTFKVRKEKLGDRITALQQLVSPFGKTDTASVLHEATEYIKFLHDQVASLSSPYLRCGRRPVQPQKQQGSSKAKDGEAKKDLRSRGLCLVPVGSTYTVANETAPEFWHPTFRGTFR